MINKKKIRVLVVDDSAFMRKAISIMIGDDPEIEVIGTANNGQDGLNKVHELSPDLVTMDIEMPQMDGLTALRRIMKEKPTPVMMVSSLTSDGAEATLEALELGAVDFIPKQLSYVSLDIVKIKEELIAKIKHINERKHILMRRARYSGIFSSKPDSGAPTKKKKTSPAKSLVAMPTGSRKLTKTMRIVAIGTSTGGPPALQAVIPRLPKEFPVPVLVVQHMPPTFTKSLANRLNGLSALEVKEAEHGDRIERGHVYIAPGDKHMTVQKQGSTHIIKLSDEPSETLYKPSVDIMMNSVEDNYKGSTLGVIMTGMGNDGVNALQRIKDSGGSIIAQNEDTCVVYGMPRAAVDAGIADKVSPVEYIARDIVSYF
ncbi:MAG: chemotaxis response regulator protein-glutamate methylesterase [candidate division Zixibacteria bacterium]|nr:chemotaxis response regulator protein-glutamate methylesterase [candidate division Zixibacteria bacterium]